MTPEQKARANIDATTGVAIREFPLNPGFGFADCLLFVNGKACGVIEAKKQGATLTGVELQSSRYAQGMPSSLPAWARPLPFVWESTGVETHFTNGLDPEPRARGVFAFFRPELLVQWLAYQPTTVRPEHVEGVALTSSAHTVQEPNAPGTFLARMRRIPPLEKEWCLLSPLDRSPLENCKTQTAQANLFQGKIRQWVVASPPFAQ